MSTDEGYDNNINTKPHNVNTVNPLSSPSSPSSPSPSPSPSPSSPERHTPFFIALLSGGIAGMAVDITLFPIDTLKTRLQSPSGFWSSGGFRGIYNGIGAVAIGSAPGAALFFSVYEYLKEAINNTNTYDHNNGGGGPNLSPMWGHMLAASMGEAAACLVRVPTEVIKQNMQAGTTGTADKKGPVTLSETFRKILSQKDTTTKLLPPQLQIFGGLYRGYGITLMREIPFAFIQFPIYEKMKTSWATHQSLPQVTPIQAALCGSISGAIAAAATTPLDVIKTRLMIGVDANGVSYKGALDVARRTVVGEGYVALFKGIEPRVLWISLGGFVFFGAYEECRTHSLSFMGMGQ